MKNIIGKKYNRLTVLKRVENDKSGNIRYLCKCDCGNEIVIRSGNIKNGSTKSCGCLRKETSMINGKKIKKYNIYDLSGDYGIGYTSNTNEPFYFDLDDYDLIKNYCWFKGENGYIYTTNNENKIISLHRLIMDFPKDIEVDHINRIKFDNKRENLRIATGVQNTRNQSLRIDNTSGIIGVSYHINAEKWRVYISVNDKQIYLGLFTDIEEAIVVRLKAEKEYFGEEFAPQRHLFKQYGI